MQNLTPAERFPSVRSMARPPSTPSTALAEEPATKADREQECSTHEAMAAVIFMGQVFSLMPIAGYGPASDPRNVTMRFLSVRFVYGCVTLLIMLTLIAMLGAYTAEQSSFGVQQASSMAYYAIIVFFMVELMLLARNWSKIMGRWYVDELPFRSAPYRPPASKLPFHRKVPLIAFSVMFLAFLEDTLNFLSAYKLNELHIRYCPHRSGFWKNFFHREHPYVLRVIPYHAVLGWTIELTMRIAKFTWHYVDVFIICLSLGLQRRFVQFNERLERLDGQPQSQTVWRGLRLDFVRLTELVTFVDERFSKLILFSCANDMFFITVQLFNSFDLKPTTVTTVYFWYSLGFLICRCFLMLFVVSSISRASERPLETLRRFPSTNWNLDLRRLCDAVATSENALSGKRFFFIRRPLILAMAGTIITYELVLLDQVKKIPDTTKDCTF
ncbi:gustatory receptor for sugar taste 64a-like [Anopheles maculipalpis]|uniref:gustatory receptor for sugar taste 64a-like n=1 Tax=Anopheles maculipalpis TaxID=1496333 RepID=UPI002158FD3F|nr:gustatory receptor for sugar taste 64a-like [Anopheles maculipalpis]